MTPWQWLHDDSRAVQRQPLAHGLRRFLAKRREVRLHARAAAASAACRAVLHDPRAAQHRRRAIGIRRRHAARCPCRTSPSGSRSSSSTRRNRVAADIANAVVAREPLVHERVVRREQLRDAALRRRAGCCPTNSSHLLDERFAQVFVEIRIQLRIGVDDVDVAHAEPLEREVRDERLRPRVREHPLDLGFVGLRIAELVALGELEQLLVWAFAPEEEREPRRELEIRDRVGLRRASRRPAGRRARRDTGTSCSRESRAGLSGCRSRSRLPCGRSDRSRAAAPCPRR